MTETNSLLQIIRSGGFVMIPLIIFSLITWSVILERAWTLSKVSKALRAFQLEALDRLVKADLASFRKLCEGRPEVPSAVILLQKTQRGKDRERLRQMQSLRGLLWTLGTIASAAPFIGLFGTVVGILQSFHQMAEKGTGGFTVVAAGISEALIATAAGIIVAVIAVVAYNSFQVWLNKISLAIRLQVEEISEVLPDGDASRS